MNLIWDIFTEFKNKKGELEVPIEVMRKEVEEYKDKLLLYGAGSAGIAFLYFLRRIDLEPKFFLDADKSKEGKVCEGIKIIPPERAVEMVGEDALVIVCINTDGKRYCKSFDEALRIGGHHAVYHKLRMAGLKNIIDYTFFRRCHQLFQKEKYNAPSCSDVGLMLQHKSEIAEVYEWLADKQSKNIFEKILRFRLLDDTLEIPTMPQERQYFEYEFYEKRNDEIFVDCGAFDGISFKAFLAENNNQFEKYYGLEPDRVNWDKLMAYKQNLPEEIQNKMTCIRKAAWMNEDKIKFYSLHGPGSFAADIGNENVETISIDTMLNGQRASYIKMNIEGSEKQALKGAEKTIKKYKPKLAVAGYHRTEDFWKIPSMIKEYREDYKLYLRSYMNHISFVYYGV